MYFLTYLKIFQKTSMYGGQTIRQQLLRLKPYRVKKIIKFSHSIGQYKNCLCESCPYGLATYHEYTATMVWEFADVADKSLWLEKPCNLLIRDLHAPPQRCACRRIYNINSRVFRFMATSIMILPIVKWVGPTWVLCTKLLQNHRRILIETLYMACLYSDISNLFRCMLFTCGNLLVWFKKREMAHSYYRL